MVLKIAGAPQAVVVLMGPGSLLAVLVGRVDAER